MTAVAWVVALTVASSIVCSAGVLPQTQSDPAESRLAEIPLQSTMTTAPTTEIWSGTGGSRSVRNVTVPTLTPFLPVPSKATGVGIIVAPGGAFMELEIEGEGYAIARWLADHGIAAFVLKYRTDPTAPDPKAFRAELMARLMGYASSKVESVSAPPLAVEDAISAIKLVRSRSSEWGLDPHRVGLIGFSAGAIEAVAVGLVEDKAARPDFIAPIYGSLAPKTVPSDAPPAFFCIALDDPLFAINRSVGLVDSWRSAHRPVEAHLYMKGGHGFAAGTKSRATGLWMDEFYAWLLDLGVIKTAN